MQKLTAVIAAGALLASVSGALAASPAAAGASTAAPAAATTQPSSQMPATTMPMHHHMAMHSKHVKAIQAALNGKGEQVTVDGLWGPKTRAALKDFQQKNGLQATGHADKATLQKLNISM